MPGLSPTDCDKRPGSKSCSAWYIARRLGHADRSPSWIIRYIGALIEREGFPPPITLYHFATDEAPPAKVAGVTLKSRWQVEAVDAWFDGQASAKVPERIATSASARVDQRKADEVRARTAAMETGR